MKTKKAFRLLASCMLAAQILSGQSYPVIKGMTVTPLEPNDDDQVVIVTSVETLFAGNRLTHGHHVKQNEFQVELLACYYAGTTGSPQTYTDTFYIGALAHGYWGISFKARLSDNPGTCAPIDSSDLATYLQVDPAPLSASAPAREDFRIWPNPCDDVVFLDFGESATLRLFGMTGMLLFERPVNRGEPVSLVSLAPGIYIAEIRAGSLCSRSRFVKL